MWIKWRSGYVAYWVRGFYYLGIGATVGGLLVWLVSWLRGGYVEARHDLSTIAAVCLIAILPFALRRRRWVLRFGHQATWLKAHWTLAGVALVLIAAHSAVRPTSVSGLSAFLLAAGIAAAGIVTHFTRRMTRHYAVRAHLALAILLLGAIGFHRFSKLDHPWFPLDTPTPKGEVVHHIACGQCHDALNRYAEYTCTTCHVHDTPELVTPHQVHGVEDYGPCLDCHKATIAGKTYFTGGSRFVWENVFDFAP
ncbi:hypothetical protein FJZ36_01870 [Candidatus Poribacteria bacterium]|nr:hypothetical protein [Candidatus Poribacteria bacterium]